MDDEFCSPTGVGCEPQWVFGAWWLVIVVGVVLAAAYARYRNRRLKRIALGLGLSPDQVVIWRRGVPDARIRLLAFGVIEISLATGLVVGGLTRSFLIGLQAATIPGAACFGIVMLFDLRWLLTLHPTADDIEALEPDH